MTNMLRNYIYKFKKQWFHFWRDISPIYININLYKCIEEWWKAKKDYKFPHINMIYGKYFRVGYYSNPYNKWLHICPYPLSYTYEVNELSFERNPYFIISLLNRWKFVIEFNSPTTNIRGVRTDHEYWESMLYYLYECDNDIDKTFLNWGWSEYNRINFENDTHTVLFTNTWDWGYIRNNEKIKQHYKNFEYLKCSHYDKNDCCIGQK